MQGLSPAHPSGFHTAALPLRHGIVLCEENEALNKNTKMYPKSEIKSINVFNVGIGFGRNDPGVLS